MVLEIFDVDTGCYLVLFYLILRIVFMDCRNAERLDGHMEKSGQ